MQAQHVIKIDMEDAPPIFLRKDTSDEIIFTVNFSENPEYNFPPVAQPKVIFDVGANIGIVSVVMANLYPDAKIYAFEPEPNNYRILKMNTEKYPNIEIYNVGLGAKNQSRDLFFSDNPSNNGGFSLHALGCDTNRRVKVDIADVAQFIAEVSGPPDVIKIDAEGAEHEVLTSILPTQLKNVEFILGEMHGTKDFETLDYLNRNGFNLAFHKPMEERVFHFYAQNKEIYAAKAKAATEEISAAKAKTESVDH